MRYAPSTAFYLAEKRAGTPWVTRLPFPVKVGDVVEVLDHVDRNRFVKRYRYRHGCFDGVEREFRGFGPVEELDRSSCCARGLEVLSSSANIDAASHTPVLTRTWFHTGVRVGGDRVSRFFERMGKDGRVLIANPVWTMTKPPPSCWTTRFSPPD